MPTRKEIAWSELKVGVLLVIALTILVAIVVLVLGVENPFAPRYTLYTYLPNIGGLRPDTPVMLEGLTVGAVDKFEFDENLDKGLKISLRIQKQYQNRIRTDSIAKLRSLGLLGDKYIEITQGTSSARVLKEGETVTGAPPLDLDQMIAKATHTFDNMSDTVDNLKSITGKMRTPEGNVGKLINDDRIYEQTSSLLGKLNSNNGSLGSFLNDRTLYVELSATASNLRRVSDQVQNGKGPVGKLLSDEQMGQSLQSSINRLESVLARLERGEGSLGKLSTDPALYNNLTALTNNLKPFTENLSRGEGTVGKLMKDEQLYNNMNKLTSEMIMLLHDVRQDPKKYLRIKFSVF